MLVFSEKKYCLLIILQCSDYLLLECPEWIHYPFYCGYPDYIVSIRLMLAIPHDSGKIKLLLRKIFLKKKFIKSHLFRFYGLFIYTRKKKNIDLVYIT